MTLFDESIEVLNLNHRDDEVVIEVFPLVAHLACGEEIVLAVAVIVRGLTVPCLNFYVFCRYGVWFEKWWSGRCHWIELFVMSSLLCF